MVTIGDAVRYPTVRDDWYRTILIGGVLTLFGFLIVPLILVYGYLVRVIQARLAGETAPPVFEEWGQLLVVGIQAFVIGLIFMLIPLIVAATTIGGAIVAFATGTEVGAGVGMLGLFVGILLSFVLALLFGYIAVAAIVNFARTERFGDAFAISEIKPILFHRDYAIGWLAGVAVILAASIIGAMLNVIPLIGWVVAAFVSFYAQIAAVSLWADGYVTSSGGRERVVLEHPPA